MSDFGWIKLHRKIQDWEWYRDGNTFRLFIHLLLSANRKPQSWKGIVIGRGDLATGRKSLSAQTGLSEQSVRTSLERLRSTNEVTSKSTSKYSIITIVNYDTYQSNDVEANQQVNHKQEVKEVVYIEQNPF